jgi:heptose I phosphotransferase
MIFFLSRELQAALAPRRSFDEVMALEGPPIRAKEGRRTFRLELGGRGYFFKIHNGIGWREIFKELASRACRRSARWPRSAPSRR